MMDVESIKTEVARHSEEIKELSKNVTEIGFLVKTFMEQLPNLGAKIDNLSEKFTNFSMPQEEDWKTKETLRQLCEKMDRIDPVVTRINIRAQHFKENKYLYAVGGGIVFLGFIALLNPEMMPHIEGIIKSLTRSSTSAVTPSQ